MTIDDGNATKGVELIENAMVPRGKLYAVASPPQPVFSPFPAFTLDAMPRSCW
jgi:hypothetical protein